MSWRDDQFGTACCAWRLRPSRRLFVLGAIAIVQSIGCRPAERSAADSERLTVFVTITPQAYFVERVGGDRVRVEVMVAAGQSYHTYEPTPLQIAALSEAKAYFGIGVPLETALKQKLGAGLTSLVFIDTSKDIQLRPGEACDHDHSSGAHDHEHTTAEGDPHIWLDPMLVKTQAREIAAALKQIDPAHAGEYETNLAAFEADLDATHARIAEQLKPHRGRAFFVFHPSFGYFADAYGLRQVSVEEAGKEPTARQLMRLVDEAKAARVRVIFIQPQFARTSAEAVAREIGGSVDVLDPLARDYLTNLELIAQRIAASLEQADQAGPLPDAR